MLMAQQNLILKTRQLKKSALKIKVKGEVKTFGYSTSGGGALSATVNSIKANFNANASAFLLNAQISAEYGPLSAKGAVSIQATANLNSEIDFDPLNGEVAVSGGGEVFAGGKAEVELGAKNDNGGIASNAGVTYGAGLESKVEVGLKDGVVKGEVDLGATVGLGVDVGIELELNVIETAKALTVWIPKTPW